MRIERRPGAPTSLGTRHAPTHHGDAGNKGKKTRRGTAPPARVMWSHSFSVAPACAARPPLCTAGFSTVFQTCCGSGGGKYNYQNSARCGMSGASACSNPAAHLRRGQQSEGDRLIIIFYLLLLLLISSVFTLPGKKSASATACMCSLFLPVVTYILLYYVYWSSFTNQMVLYRFPWNRRDFLLWSACASHVVGAFETTLAAITLRR
jgi:hypothetical protein